MLKDLWASHPHVHVCVLYVPTSKVDLFLPIILQQALASLFALFLAEGVCACVNSQQKEGVGGFGCNQALRCLFCLNSGKRDQSPQHQGPGSETQPAARTNPLRHSHTHSNTKQSTGVHRCTDASSGNALDSCRSEAVVLEARCLAVIQTSLKRQAQRSTAVQSYCNIMCFFSRGAHNFLRSCRKEWQIRSL